VIVLFKKLGYKGGSFIVTIICRGHILVLGWTSLTSHIISAESLNLQQLSILFEPETQ